MSRSRHGNRQPNNPRRVSARGVRRAQLDNKKLSRALINFALQQAAEEAAAEQEAQRRRESRGA